MENTHTHSWYEVTLKIIVWKTIKVFIKYWSSMPWPIFFTSIYSSASPVNKCVCYQTMRKTLWRKTNQPLGIKLDQIRHCAPCSENLFVLAKKRQINWANWASLYGFRIAQTYKQHLGNQHHASAHNCDTTKWRWLFLLFQWKKIGINEDLMLQSSASLAFVPGIHRWPGNSPHKWPVTRKMSPLDDVIMTHHCLTSGT